MAITPLIQRLAKACPSTQQCWYADDDGAGDDLVTLRKYWDELTRAGPGYGYMYNPNPTKTGLVTKPEHGEDAGRLFADTGVVDWRCGLASWIASW